GAAPDVQLVVKAVGTFAGNQVLGRGGESDCATIAADGGGAGKAAGPRRCGGRGVADQRRCTRRAVVEVDLGEGAAGDKIRGDGHPGDQVGRAADIGDVLAIRAYAGQSQAAADDLAQ